LFGVRNHKEYKIIPQPILRVLEPRKGVDRTSQVPKIYFPAQTQLTDDLCKRQQHEKPINQQQLINSHSSQNLSRDLLNLAANQQQVDE
jgi:hypothetical protein